MIHYEIERLPDYIFPGDEWRFVERDFHPDFLAETETFFATSNGYLGLRGSCEEGDPVHLSGTVINGFYESWPIIYGETAYGFAKTGQTIVNVTDAKIIRLYVDDEPLYLPTANLLRFERALDFRSGTLDRDVLWETARGKRVSVRSRRLVSLEQRHVAAIAYDVTLENASAPVVISSELRYQPLELDTGGDQRLGHGVGGRVLHPRCADAGERRIVLGHGTERSHMTLACGVDHTFETECPYTEEASHGPDEGRVVFSVDAQPGVPIRLIKYMAYHSSRRVSAQELLSRAQRTLDRARRDGFGTLLDQQRRHVEDFWSRADVQLSSQPAEVRGRAAPEPEHVQQALRFNLFHVLQATSGAEGVGIPAKGLTGIGYEGHYFWDTEVYLIPFLVYTQPRIARNLLRFRFSFLDKARERARELSQRGALFAWRTINGEEASAYYAAGTAQYHINADIVYALRKYVNATGDDDFLFDEGAEVLVETARLWRDLGFFSEERGGKFCIAGVTGPDEYNTVVNNNLFTNLMARENLRYAAETLERLRAERPDQFRKLVDRTGLDEAEPSSWRDAGEAMFLPYDEAQGIHLQDDEFLEKKPWDFEASRDKHPLLLHYHPLVIYRHQVIKQADVVLAVFQLGDQFTHEQKKRTFDFYDPLTTGDSSLSACIQSVVASEIGYADKAVEYARYALLMDLADLGKNVKDGLHMASMGGTWMVTVYGFAGFRDHGGCFSFQPRPSEGLERLAFPLTLRGQIVDVEMTREAATYTLRDGAGLSIWHEDEQIELRPGAPETRAVKSGPQTSRVPGRAPEA